MAEQRVWLARGGKDGDDEDYALDHGLAMIGFREVPSLASTAGYEDVRKCVDAALPGFKAGARGNFAGQLWAFVHGMKEGDIVVLPRKLTSQIALGRVAGPYQYVPIEGAPRHTRPVEWLKPDLPRTAFGQDLLYSFGAFMTVCNIKRNGAEDRIAAVLAGTPDPGMPDPEAPASDTPPSNEPDVPEVPDLVQVAHDQVVAHVQARFKGHAMALLVDSVLKADGWVTKLSPPGPDGGVDILGGRGALGLDAPRLCVQVKSQNSPADVTVYRTLQGTMQTFKADQGLLVWWGGFNKVVLNESKQGHFTVRLWDSSDLVEAIYRNYDRLPAEIQAELPLKRVWMLVAEVRPQ